MNQSLKSDSYSQTAIRSITTMDAVKSILGSSRCIPWVIGSKMAVVFGINLKTLNPFITAIDMGNRIFFSFYNVFMLSMLLILLHFSFFLFTAAYVLDALNEYIYKVNY